MDPVDVIAAKRDGAELSADDLRRLILDFARGVIADYQMAAFLMAGYLRGFSAAETEAMTGAMVASGTRLDLSALTGPTVDKHSTGGVGDGTTLVVAPLAAELGMQMVKLSGRGLGHTGGTLDKLESIPGLRVELSPAQVEAQVAEIGLAVSAQTEDLVPADRALYALRDVTATIGSVPLIASSIMSKKLAGGAQTILLDVKTGSGAFMKDLDSARELARTCVELGRAGARTTGAVITDMSQPLGDMIGNALEVREVIEVLRGERSGRFTDLCLRLAGCLAWFSGLARSEDDGVKRARHALDSGGALERFGGFVEAQGGDRRVIDDPSRLPAAPVIREVAAPRSAGWLAGVDAQAIGLAAMRLGAGRRRKDDAIDPAVGIELLAKLGNRVSEGTVLGYIHARTPEAAGDGERQVLDALAWSEAEPAVPQLVHELIEPDDAATAPRADADAGALHALVQRAYGRYVERIGRRPRPMDDDYADKVANGWVTVAVDGGRIVGAIVLELGEDHVFIDNVAVEPDRQGTGVGRALLSFAESQARERGLSELRLYTNSAMTENLALYARIGYVETARRPGEGFRRVYMSKWLHC